jgi:hypothetical protein
MPNTTNRRSPLLPLLRVGVAAFLCGVGAQAQTPEVTRTPAVSEAELDALATAKALEKALGEIRQIRDQLTQAESTIGQLQKNLAVASSESEVFRRTAAEFKLRLEALGIEGGGGDRARLEQRVLKAVSDLNLAETGRRKMQEALIALCEAIIHYQKVTETTDPDARLVLEAQMRNAFRALGGSSELAEGTATAPTTLTDGTVISIKDDLALIVANVGRSQGARMGMPFQVLRGTHIVGTVRIVDVRDKISGAVIQDLTSEKERIQVGDRLKLLAQQ